MTLKKINEILIEMEGVEIERVSDIDCFHTRQALAGIKFILRDGDFDIDFATFKDVKIWFNGLMFLKKMKSN